MNDHLRFPAWQTPYVDALAELDPRRILERVDAAESAIFQRLAAMADHPGSIIELQTMDAALARLIVLRAGTAKTRQEGSRPV